MTNKLGDIASIITENYLKDKPDATFVKMSEDNVPMGFTKEQCRTVPNWQRINS